METPQSASLYTKIQNPFNQLILVLGSSFLMMIIGLLLKLSGIVAINPEFPWLTSAAFILIFAVLSAVIAIYTTDIEAYFRRSIMAFALLVLVSGGLAFLFSGKGIASAGTYKYIYAILVFVYLALLSIGGLIKRIAMAIQKEEDIYKARGNEKNGQ